MLGAHNIHFLVLCSLLVALRSGPTGAQQWLPPSRGRVGDILHFFCCGSFVQTGRSAGMVAILAICVVRNYKNSLILPPWDRSWHPYMMNGLAKWPQVPEKVAIALRESQMLFVPSRLARKPEDRLHRAAIRFQRLCCTYVFE